MIDIDKDYLITVNLKNTKIKSDKTLFFYNTDLNICNIFIQLVCTGSDKTIPDDLIVEFAVLKPETNEFKPLDATLISKEDLLYQVDLTTDYLDIIGTYECEIRVSGTIDNETKCFTSESFDYVVRPNITAKLNNQIKQDKNLPILEKLIKEVNDIGLGIEMNQVQLKKDDNLVGDNKSIVGAINQLREDVNSGGKVELKDYQKKTDDNLATEEKTIVGAVNEINSKTITLEKDDTSFDGVDDTIHDNLTTTDKRIIGAINEVNAQYKDIVKKVESGNIGNNVEPALMDMPRIYFSEGTLPTTKTATMMRFDYYSKTNEYHGWAEIKCQGTSSMSYPKKNFTIKLYKDKAKTEKLKIDFKGWGKQSKFVLKANWIDITHARNVVSARIWGDIVKSRSGYTNLPELLKTSPNQGAIDGFPITVYGNGYYQGRYTLNIPKDKWMANMDDSLDTHCILCGENYGSGCFRVLPKINGEDWTDELHDIVPASIKTSWTNAIKFVMNSSDSEFKANLSKYFDVNSLIDYLLYGIISTGLDAFGKNQIYMTYDGIKWIASMYDMDSTWGLWPNGLKMVPNTYAREQFEDFNGNGREGNLLYIRLQKLFINEIKTRYAELRQNIFTYPYLINKFEEFIQICPQDIVKEDYASTTANGAYTGIPSTTTNNIQQIRTNIKERLDYVDSYINSLVEPIPCTAITLNNKTLSFTTAGAQTLTATVTPTDTTDTIIWSVTPTGICTVENGVVTPIKNGNCTITATCGSQSTTCSITVNLPVVAVTALKLNKDNITLGTSTTDMSKVNLLEGVDANVSTKGDLIFNTVTLDKGYYVLKNINGGTNTWLKIVVNNKESLGENNTKERGVYIFEDNSSVKAQCYLVDGNTKDNLGLYKTNNIEINNSTALVKTGDGFLLPTSLDVHTSDNDEYSIVDLDISKKYCVRTNFSSLYTAGLACIIGVKDSEIVKTLQTHPNYYLTEILIENSNKLYMSIPKTIGIENVNLVEVTTSNSSVTTSHYTDTVTATLTPSDANNKAVTWSSDNNNVELIPDGLNCTVKAKAVGNSVVTCTSQDTTNGTISDTCNVTIS